MQEGLRHPTFREALRFWIKLGFINFGGPSGQIAIMHEELVEKRRWISEERFLHALNYCMLLPGPEAQQLATYIGWLLHKTWGGLVAGLFFILPGLVVLLGLSAVYVTHGDVPSVEGVFLGLKAVVLAIVAHAVFRIGRTALKTAGLMSVAGLAFVAIYFLGVAFPFIIAAAALAGMAGHRWLPRHFRVPVTPHGEAPAKSVLGDADAPPEHTRPDRRQAVRIALAGALLWLLPLSALVMWPGEGRVFLQEGLFFTQVALVTFGGAYAVLAFMAQVSVQTYGWLAPGQMIDGLGLAESTPGPLIMVVTFVGFLAGHNFHGPLDPLVAGVFGGLIATYFTFLPSFLFIFLGAPHIERLRGNLRLTAALSAITAAVVGVILNLAVFFGTNVLLDDGVVQLFPLALASFTFVLLSWRKVGVIPVILMGAAAGLAHRLLV